MKVIAEDTISLLYGDDFVNSITGRRNLILNSSGNEKKGFFANFTYDTDGNLIASLKSQKVYSHIDLSPGYTLKCRDYTVGSTVVFSFDIMYTEWNFPEGTDRKEFWIGQRYTFTKISGEAATGQWRGVTLHALPIVGQNGCELNQWYHASYILTIPEQASDNVNEAASIQFYNSNPDIEASVTFRLKNVKLEYGADSSPWTPAPEDLESRLMSAETSIENNATEIALKASQTDIDIVNDNLATFKSTTTTMLQDINGWQFNWSKVLNVNGADVENHNDYITFNEGDIILGESGSDLKVKIGNDAIQFKGTSENEIEPDPDATAWITGQKFNINEGEVHRKLKIGKLQFLPRENGNLSISLANR